MKLPRGALGLAISQAMKSNMQHKHGAVIWKSKTILGAGYNYHMTSPNMHSVNSRRRVSIHSEKDCLNGIRGDYIRGASILAVRVTGTGQLSHGSPCVGCKKLLKRKGIAKIFWFDEQGDLTVTYIS